MGTILDWGKALRAHRARTGINQQSLADQLGISQPQVSRIEAGTAEPRDDVTSAIRALLERPNNRSLFDGLMAAIQFSPHVICLVQLAGDNVRYVALSRGFREHPQFRRIEVGQTVRKDASRNGEVLLLDTIGSGIFDGEITAIDAVWITETDQHHNHWQGIMTPIRSAEGGWYLHCAMKALDADAYADLLANRETPLVLHTLH
ncbi:helix-turn-helix transcriptional regulator [Maricaulis sp.]|uniref:helix-turn-helix domain-containing protein n=1 Tax=Maricaulis sp. TaxID=1486257 RepID=UPI0025C5FD08|nr:helix-turn-helix transcriptional regulator [Maricaulis sp.]